MTKHTQILFSILCLITIFGFFFSKPFTLLKNNIVSTASASTIATLADDTCTNLNCVKTGLKNTGTAAGYQPKESEVEPQKSIEETIGTVINFFLGFLLSIFFILTLYGGYLWMTARGNEEQISKAKSIIAQAIIGMAIVMLSYIITFMISGVIIKGTDFLGGDNEIIQEDF